MANLFLIQIDAGSYSRLMDTHTYLNGTWARKRRDRDHGEIKIGDTVLFYCTGTVADHPKSLALRAEVEDVSPDNTLLTFDEPHKLRPPVPRDRILELVNDGELEEGFLSCGAQGFNVTKLSHESLEALVEFESPFVRTPGPLDALIETKLEDYIVQNWRSIDFGSRLKLFAEAGEAVGQQYDTREIGRIDLLCEDEDSSDLVVIELKRGRPPDEVIGQLARYIGWAQRRLANGRRVRGIVLAPEFDARLRYAAQAIPGVDLLRYQIRFEIHRENLTTPGRESLSEDSHDPTS